MARQPNPTDAGAGDRRRQARAAQQAAAARVKRRRTIVQVAIIGGVAVVVAAIIATAAILGSRGGSATPTGSATVSLDGKQVPLAITDTGVRLGPDDAKVKLDLWVDYSCPVCKQFEAENNQRLNDLVTGGNVSVTYHNIQVHGPYGTPAGAAAICVAQHDPNAWPGLNAALYANASDATEGWGASDFVGFVGSNGAGAQSQKCISDGTYAKWVTTNTAAGAKQGINGTPTMFVDGKQVDTLSGQALTDRVNQLLNA